MANYSIPGSLTTQIPGVKNPMQENLAAGGFKLTGLAVPTADADSCTKKYADDLVGGSNEFKELTDVTGAYTTGLALYRTNAAVDGLEETTITVLADEEGGGFTFGNGSGESAVELSVTTSCTINQNLSSSSDISFNSVTLPFGGFLYFNGITGTIAASGAAIAMGLTFTLGALMPEPAVTEISVAGYNGALSIDWVLALKSSSSDFVLNSAGTGSTLSMTDAKNLTVSETCTIDQDIQQSASPTFAGATLSGLNTANGIVQTSGAGVLSSSTTLPDGTIATTQTAADNSTKLATTAYVDGAVGTENLWDRAGTVLSPHTAGDSIDIGTASISAGSLLANGGTLTIGGVGGTNNENLTFDFETGPNSVTIASTTGTALVYWTELLSYVTLTGTAKTTVDFLVLDNIVTNADMDGTGTGIQFLQRAFGASSSDTSGRLAIYTETDWVSATAASKDSYMSFQTCLNGTVAEGMRLTSAKTLKLSATTEAVSEVGSFQINPTIGDTKKLAIGYSTNDYAWLQSTNTGTSPTPLIFQPTSNSTTGVMIGGGGIKPSSLLDIQQAGTVTATTDLLELTNSGNAGAMTATGTGILFNQYYHDVGTPAVADAGRIAVLTEGNWTSTPADQDSKMSFQTCLNGAVAEKMHISSAGKITNAAQVPTANSSMLSILATGADTTNTGVLTQGIAIINTDATTDNTAGLFFNDALDSPLASIVCKYTDRTAGNKDTVLTWSTAINGTLTNRMAMDNNGNLIISEAGSILPSAALDLERAGTAGTEESFLELSNTVRATLNTTSSIIWFHNASDDQNYNSAKLMVGAEGTWTADGASQDSYMTFQTALNGFVAEKMHLSSTGNLGLGVSAFGTSATNTLGIYADGTVPSSSPAGMVQIYADDSSVGAANATLALRTEQAVEDVGTFTATHKLRVWINGVEYWITLDAV